MLVREATVQDVSRILYLYNILSPTDANNVLPQRISEFSVSVRDFLLVAELNGLVVGTLTLNICLNAQLGSTNYAVVENICVDPLFRGEGIATTMLKEVELLCIDCEKLMVMSSNLRSEMHSLLHTLGYNSSNQYGFKKYLK